MAGRKKPPALTLPGGEGGASGEATDSPDGGGIISMDALSTEYANLIKINNNQNHQTIGL